jgi:integrase
MAEVKFYLERRKDKATGKLITHNVPILLFYSFEGQRLQYYTGFRVDSAKWNAEDMKVKKNYSEAAEYNRELIRLKAKVEELHDKANVNGLIPDLDYFRDNLSGKAMSTPDRKTIWEAYEDFIKAQTVIRAKNTVTSDKCTRSSLEDFSRSRKIRLSFEKMDMQFYEEYLDYCYNEKGYFNNYVGTLIKRIKAFLNWAHKKGFNNTLHFKKEEFEKPTENTEIIYLHYAEVELLMGLDEKNFKGVKPDDLKKYLEVRDMYCLGCYTGMRHSDIITLKPENIEKDRIVLQIIKVREPNIIPLNPHSRRILKRNANKHGIYAMAHYNVSDTNEYLKEVMKAAKMKRKVQIVHYRGSIRHEEIQALWQCAKFHSSKKTFVTNFLERGGSLTTAMAITGNTSYQTARRYYKIADTLRAKEMGKVFGK